MNLKDYNIDSKLSCYVTFNIELFTFLDKLLLWVFLYANKSEHLSYEPIENSLLN